MDEHAAIEAASPPAQGPTTLGSSRLWKLPELPDAMDGCGRGRPQPPTASLENAARHAARDSRRFPQLLGNPGEKPPGFPQPRRRLEKHANARERRKDNDTDLNRCATINPGLGVAS